MDEKRRKNMERLAIVAIYAFVGGMIAAVLLGVYALADLVL